MGKPRVKIDYLVMDSNGDKAGVVYKRDFDGLPEDKVKVFIEAVEESKGNANNAMCFNMAMAGCDKDSIIAVGNTLMKNYRSDQIEKVFTKNERMKKKVRGQKSIYTSVWEHMFWRLIERAFGVTEDNDWLKQLYKNSMTLSEANKPSMFKEVLNNTCYDETIRLDVNEKYTHGPSPFQRRYCLKGICTMLKMDEVKRQLVLADKDICQHLVVRCPYSLKVPSGLKNIGIDESRYQQIQVEDYFEDLYALANRKECNMNLGKLDEQADLMAKCWYRTLSEAGHQNVWIKDAKTLAAFDVAMMSLEAIGLGIVSQKIYSVRALKRGYGRLLVQCRNMHKEYTKLVKQGFTPELAQKTVKTMLESWLSKNSNTAGYWRVFERKDWKPADVKPQTKKSTKSDTAHKASFEDMERVLGGKS